jgi:serine/threonine-protein kinase
VAVDSADNLYVLTGAVANKSDKTVQPGQVLKIVPEK